MGRHKSIVFRRVLGLSSADAGKLREWLLHAVLVQDAEPGRQDEFGQRYTVDFPVTTPQGTAVIRSAWIIGTSETFPRLVP